MSIQKTVSGLELAEGESKAYTFDIYSADGKLYDTVSVTIGSDATIGLASVSEVPYGTYYIVERDASAEGYTLVATYTVDGSNRWVIQAVLEGQVLPPREFKLLTPDSQTALLFD